MLTPKQFGFVLNGHHAFSLHSLLIPYLNNESIKVVYTDIQKPFDSVSHQRVIKTLTQHRLHESLVNWFKEYLRNR